VFNIHTGNAKLRGVKGVHERKRRVILEWHDDGNPLMNSTQDSKVPVKAPKIHGKHGERNFQFSPKGQDTPRTKDMKSKASGHHGAR
jgi:hypothetical protein